MFFMAMDWFNKVFKVFPMCFRGGGIDFWVKNKIPYFYGHHSGQILRMSKPCIIFFLVANRLVTRGIDFVHVNIFNLLIKTYLSLIFIKYFINKFNI